VKYTKKELPSKGTNNPRHVIAVKGSDPVVLPLNRMPSDRKPEDAGGESFDWGPLDVPDSAMGDAQITDWAIEQLQSKFDQPFFLGVGYYRPHIPLWAPRKYFERFEGQKIQLPAYLKSDLDDLGEFGNRFAIEAVTAGLHSTVTEHGQWEEAVKAYLACTSFVDAQIGRLLDALDTGQYGENTVIVLWGDHGWHLGEKQHWGKWTGWERSTRVPLIIIPPKRSAEQFPKLGQSCASPVGLIDLYPTLAELCQVQPPDSLDGQSLVPLLKDPQGSTGQVVLTSFDPGNVSLRSLQWRYIRYADETEEFYDLMNDPNEWANLAGKTEHEKLLTQFRGQIPPAAIK
jgi:arylsulfatase A-like enzyme